MDTDFAISPTVSPKSPALIINPGSGYRAEKANPLDPNIPGGIYIIDTTTHKAIAIVARDGQIYAVDPGVKLSATKKDDYLLIDIKK